ncbi:unnamed protein product [Rhodiola kirilowii]
MDLWDRICTNLGVRQITVEDVSKKRGMYIVVAPWNCIRAFLVWEIGIQISPWAFWGDRERI